MAPLPLQLLLALVSLRLAPVASSSAASWAEADETVQLLQTFAERSPAEVAEGSSHRLAADAFKSSVHEAAADPAKNKLLMFYVVGSTNKTMATVVRNIDQARAFEVKGRARGDAASRFKVAEEPLEIDVYFVHYDFNRSGWQMELGEWYAKNVQYSAQLKGIKFWLAKDLLLQSYKQNNSSRFFSREDPDDVATAEELVSLRANLTFNESEAFSNTSNATTLATIRESLMGNGGISVLSKTQLAKLPVVDIFSYEYVWFLDEDADISSIDVRQMVRDARATGANIVGPSVLFPGESGDPRPARKEERLRLKCLRWFNSTNCTEANFTTNATGISHSSNATGISHSSNATGISHSTNITGISHSDGLGVQEHLQKSHENKTRRIEAALQKRQEEMKRKREERDAEMLAQDEARKTHRRRRAVMPVSAMREKATSSEDEERLVADEAREAVDDERASDKAWEAVEENDVEEGRSGCQALDSLCDLQAPMLSCDYRYTNFVEISFPLVKPGAFAKVVGDCPFCLRHRGSVWGLDRLWCTMAANQFADVNRSCAILDRYTLVHQNQKTLPKWQDEIRQQMDHYNWGVFNESKARGRQFWVENVTTLGCHNTTLPLE